MTRNAARVSIFTILISFAISPAISSVTLVDGRRIEVEVLFEHPGASLLVMRSANNRTLQSLPKKIIHSYTKGDSSKTLNPQRKLNQLEERELERNTLTGYEVGPGQIGKYATEDWEPLPALIWARPGESGDGLDFKNWLNEKGETLTEDPWQREILKDNRGRPTPEQGTFHGDILLPQSDVPYEALQSGNRDFLGAFTVRHLTVERNAEYAVRYTVTGNLWIKDGSKIGKNTQTGGLGSRNANKHTFARFCNWHDLEFEPRWAYAPFISHWVRVDTGDYGSIEIIGKSGGPSDRFSLTRGTFIVSVDGAFRCGDRAAFYTAPGTTLILLDGAKIGSPEVLQGGSAGKTMGTYGIGGTILFGTKEKPLTRDLEFTACRYDIEKLNKNSLPSDRASGASYIFGPESRAIIHSSNPEKARVIFSSREPNMPLKNGPRQFIRRDSRTKLWLPPDPKIWEHPEMHRGIIAIFAGETDFNGVHFDYFHEGGIVVDPNQRANWRNVTFGDNNLAPPERLFQPLE